eukprot:COSAG05_NODE_21873_length_268_cov_1.769231_1_plen_33_part_01
MAAEPVGRRRCLAMVPPLFLLLVAPWFAEGLSP